MAAPGACTPRARARRWAAAAALLWAGLAPGAAPELSEAYIELRVDGDRGDSFYRVMVDAGEQPYLPVAEVTERWLDMVPDCRAQRRYCQVTYTPTGRVYWIDGEAGQLGDDGGRIAAIPAGALVRHEDTLWLRHDAWAPWMDVASSWTLYTYSLGLTPGFPLLDDLRERREKARRMQHARQRAEARLAALPLTTAPRALRGAGRYRVQAGRSVDGEYTTQVDYEALADVWGGTFQLGGNASRGGGDGGALEYWRYRQLDRPGYHLLELGQTRYGPGVLVPGLSLENGLRWNRLEVVSGTGPFELEDRTRPGTEIDVYRNGFLQETLEVGESGRYLIDEQYVAGGDRLVLRFYYPDGSQGEEVIRIAPDNGRVLARGAWDAGVHLGRAGDDGRFAHAGARYGLGDHFSAGAHLYHIPGGDAPAPLLDVAWRPLSMVGVLAEAMLQPDGADVGLRADVTGLPASTLQLEYRRLDGDSPLLGLTGLDTPTTRLWRVRHALQLARWNVLTEYRHTAEGRALESGVAYRARRDLSAFVDAHWRRGDVTGEQRGGRLGLVYDYRTDTRFELTRGVGEGAGGWGASLRHQGGTGRGWDVGLDLTETDDGGIDGGLSLTWRADRRLAFGVHARRAGVGFEVTWLNAVAPQPGPDYWDEFATGTVSGRVAVPDPAGNGTTPLSGVTVRAGARSAVTDAQGDYIITGVPTGQRLYVSVDDNSLDATLAPLQEAAAVRLRPGTHLRVDPALTWTAGLDGYVVREGGVPPGTRLEVQRVADDGIAATVAVAEDGFFLVEGLVPGRYRLRVLDLPEAAPARVVELPPGADWLPDVRIAVERPDTGPARGDASASAAGG